MFLFCSIGKTKTELRAQNLELREGIAQRQKTETGVGKREGGNN